MVDLEFTKEKRGHFLYRLFFPKEIFFNICVLSQYMVYWIHFSKYTYFYILKNITSYTFLFVFKIVESLQCILKWKLDTLKVFMRPSYLTQSRISNLGLFKCSRCIWVLLLLWCRNRFVLVITCLRGEFGINLPSSLFWYFEIFRVKRGRFQNFKKWTR